MSKSFVDEFPRLPLGPWAAGALGARLAEVDEILTRRGTMRPADFAALLSPAAGERLERLAALSRSLTRQRFGRAIRFFAPLYLSNECINNCSYCGFSRDHAILRVTLSVDEAVREAKALRARGFRNVLLVAGEHPRFVTGGYLRECVRAVGSIIPSVSLEVGPMDVAEYRTMVEAGAEGLVVYQETYDRRQYGSVHTLGPKKDFDWRLATAERGYAAGFRRLGIGALFGLSDWRHEAFVLAAHARWLLRHCWKAQLTISLPRLRPCAGDFQPPSPLGDRELVQLLCALRLYLPDVGLVLSTREPESLRDGLIPLGITLMSAGSHTEPGGYTGAGSDKVHYTTKGRISFAGATEWDAEAPGTTRATGQFEIADHRPAETVAGVVSRLGLDPVWKDWDSALNESAAGADPQT